jgi:D-xylose transport system permease protein
VLYAFSTLSGVVSRRRHGIISDNLVLVGAKLVVVSGAVIYVVWWLNDKARGVPFVALVVIFLLVFLTWVTKRTRFGRHVYAVGGNAEAARRAGINVRVIRWWVFGISGAMAGLGGVIFASRLSSVDLNAGGGTILLDAIAAAVIGGTSLFGGRGEIKSALLGALIIASIANGMSLLGYSSATQYIVTGIILLAAVTLDTISRRRLAASGR